MKDHEIFINDIDINDLDSLKKHLPIYLTNESLNNFFCFFSDYNFDDEQTILVNEIIDFSSHNNIFFPKDTLYFSSFLLKYYHYIENKLLKNILDKKLLRDNSTIHKTITTALHLEKEEYLKTIFNSFDIDLSYDCFHLINESIEKENNAFFELFISNISTEKISYNHFYIVRRIVSSNDLIKLKIFLNYHKIDLSFQDNLLLESARINKYREIFDFLLYKKEVLIKIDKNSKLYAILAKNKKYKLLVTNYKKIINF
jgi:hypothetical protein